MAKRKTPDPNQKGAALTAKSLKSKKQKGPRGASVVDTTNAQQVGGCDEQDQHVANGKPESGPGLLSEMNVDSASAQSVAKEKVLVLCSRGTGARFRHLMLDCMQLLPHCKKDSKLDTKSDRAVINEVAEMKGCTGVMFFETRKKKDLYVWMSKSPEGPTVKFLAQNIHTMSELRLSGNHLKGSRPVLVFDKKFENGAQWQVVKEVLKQIFVTPHKHQKSKPFFDHVIMFSLVDDRVWLRNYQVVYQYQKSKVNVDSSRLVEVGPRVCLQPIKIFDGSFRGRTLYHNPEYVSPNHLRAAVKRRAAEEYKSGVDISKKRKKNMAKLPIDESSRAFE